jgi:transcription elongation GreA/GreB family factor
VTEVVAWAAGNGDRSENADYQYGKRRLRTATPDLIPALNLLMQ